MMLIASRSGCLLLAVASLVSLCPVRATADYAFSPNADGPTSCDVIASGTVLSLDVVRDFDDHSSLWVATVYLARVSKGEGLVPGSCVDMFFVRGRDGWVRDCPSEVELRVGDAHAFFVTCVDLDQDESRLVLPSAEHVCSLSEI